MERFLKRHQSRIAGVLSGFDRMLFRGTRMSICHAGGTSAFLGSQRVLYKDYEAFVTRLSDRIKDHAKGLAQTLQRPAALARSGPRFLCAALCDLRVFVLRQGAGTLGELEIEGRVRLSGLAMPAQARYRPRW